MLIIEDIEYRNFLSSGNSPIKINFLKDQLTLICGGNGKGKTMTLDALCFVLFDKAFRNINKPQLVNSINQKNCEVIVNIETGGIKYKIIRGIKPNKFEIWQSGSLINQDPSVKDYQKVLEQQILKMNYRSFTQIVVMGSSSYVPFMKLPTPKRREFIEDLLDIKIFSIMSSLLKDKIKKDKDEIKDLDKDIGNLKEKIELLNSFVKQKTSDQNAIIDRLKYDISEISRKSIKLSNRVKRVQNNVTLLETQREPYDVMDQISDVRMHIAAESRLIEKNQTEKLFYDGSNQCPKCSQEIDPDFKFEIIEELDANTLSIQDKITGYTTDLARLNGLYDEYVRLSAIIKYRQTIVTSMNRTLINNRELVVKKQKEIEDNQVDTSSLSDDRAKIKTYAMDVIEKTERKKELIEQNHYHVACSVLLHDTGLKSKIIKQFIPVINKFVNDYLDRLDFFVSFNLDENFNEVVKSRHRDTFTYDSFSEGQKMRINLALIFAWREVAKLKNSVNTNLVFFDELFDGSLEASAIDLAFEMLGEMKGSNIFVISHRDNIAEKFDNVIHVDMKNNFSYIIEES